MGLETAYIRIYSYDGTGDTPMTQRAQNALRGNGSFLKSGGDLIPVQFNPAKLSFSSNQKGVGEKDKVSVNQGKDQRMEHAPAQEKMDDMRLKIPLVFDRSLSAVHSVIPVVEGFLTMIEDSYVRRIAFCWGTQYYEGVLESVSAEYELFDPLGTPMRAKVDLDIKMK